MKVQLASPITVKNNAKTLQDKGFLTYLVGGCVRDLLMAREPRDWDLNTNATPEEIVEAYPKTFYENKFGTVTIVNEEETDLTLKNIEVTPFRTEGAYEDFRHPQELKFSQNLAEDLARRDFTINALAYDPWSEELTDPFDGLKDIKDKIIRAVGDPDERFQEDALRLLRAVRLATELGFTIEDKTLQAAQNKANLLAKISKERIRDEFIKIIMSPNPAEGLTLCSKIGLLAYIIPELEAGLNMKQNKSHIYSVWEHSLRTVQHSADRDFSLQVRLTALLHDIGKPKTRRLNPETQDFTFYGHEVVGERLAKKILSDLKFPVKTIEIVTKLVRNHMFFSDTEKITLSAVRRIIANVGEDLVQDLIKVRICDRIGMGRPKEEPYRLRKYEAMIDEAMHSPTSVKMLKIDGQRLIEISHETPGPKFSLTLHALLEEVLDQPELNTNEYLEKRALELMSLPIEELKKLGEAGKEKKEATEAVEIKKIHKKYGV